MTDDPRRLVLLGFGLLLVTTPVWAPALHVTGPDYEYRAALVTAEDDRLAIPREPPRPEHLDGVDCFGEATPSRLCGFESRLVGTDARDAPYPGVRHVAGEPSLSAPERYVAFAGDGRVFERTTAWNDSAGAYVLGLERANATRVLAERARPVEGYPPAVRTAVRTGSARSADPLSEAVLVESSGRYYAVYTTGTRTLLSERPVAERLLELAAAVFGAALLWRAGRRDETPQ